MASPVKPSQFEAVIVNASDSLGTAFVKTFIRMPILFYKWFKYAFDANGDFTDKYASELCAVDCGTSDETTE